MTAITICQLSKYASHHIMPVITICLPSKYACHQNMPAIKICQASQYVSHHNISVITISAIKIRQPSKGEKSETFSVKNCAELQTTCSIVSVGL